MYCDFCSFTDKSDRQRAAYVDALCREILSYRPRLVGYVADTVYIGGGTPSCLTPSELKRVLCTLRAVFPIEDGAEVTCEVNPATADRGTLTAWREAGINRLSVGVQSFSDTELTAIGRLHTAEEAEDFIRVAQSVGFQNISLDLMYGLPGQTKESFEESLYRAVKLCPTHISAYSLKVESGTPFDHMKDTLNLPDEDAEVEMYETCIATLGTAGYTHYEISNYARPGYESRHNLRYWRMEEYIGVGVAAYSYFEGKRYGCDRDFDGYIGRTFPTNNGVIIEETDREEETVMLGLRLKEGIREADFRASFGYGFWEKYGDALAPHVKHGLVVHDDERTCLTDAGMYVSLGILSEILV